MCSRVLTLFSTVCCPFIYLYIFVVSYFFHLSLSPIFFQPSPHTKKNQKNNQSKERKILVFFLFLIYFKFSTLILKFILSNFFRSDKSIYFAICTDSLAIFGNFGCLPIWFFNEIYHFSFSTAFIADRVFLILRLKFVISFCLSLVLILFFVCLKRLIDK